MTNTNNSNRACLCKTINSNNTDIEDLRDGGFARSLAIVTMLMEQFDGKPGDRSIDDHTVANALWAVQGELDLVKAL